MLNLRGPLILGVGGGGDAKPVGSTFFTGGRCVVMWSTHHMTRWGRMGDVVLLLTCWARL
jgi:hypothetical protein